MTSGTSSVNPFVGPRPIQVGEALHGRKREVRELFEQLQARRIVVLHSPSGAGKSSLVHAGLIPRLRQTQFDVWKPIRVNLDPSTFTELPPETNRYLLSALISLEEELPEARRRSPAELARLSLLEYLETRPRRKNRAQQSVVLLFDQFEEILSVGPRAIAAKEEFFASVGAALDTGKYWALFIIREDYLAALAPYRDLIPTQLFNTYRLDLLGLEGAREAAVKLAAEGGREFPAVDKLIHDLSIVQIQQADGSFTEEQGIHVEPVYLQVVCRRLWEAMPAEELVIDEHHIEAHAGITESLAAYYADTIRAIAGQDVATERAIRDWVGDQLIIGGIRSQVRQETGASGGLDNALIQQLLDAYLVRTEQRAGANWFELSHDRLVEPVQANNEAWEQDHLHPVQVQAKLWEQGGRSRGLLYRAEALPAALAWARDNPRLITAAERAYLDASEARYQDLMRRRARQRQFSISMSIVTVVALGFAGLAWSARRKAEDAQAQAEAASEVADDERDRARAATKVAETKQAQAVEQQREAEAQKQRADEARQNAELLQKQNERLMQQVFDAALRPFVDRLAEGGQDTGVVEVDGERWMALLREGDQVLVAALVDVNRRIIVASDRRILGEVDRRGQSLFIEIAAKWLLADLPERKIGLLAHSSPHSKVDELEANLRLLEYEYLRIESLADTSQLDELGMLVVDDMWAELEPAARANFEAFIDRGGGVLAVGEGWSWAKHQAAHADPPPPLSEYPMNELLAALGAAWTETTVPAAEIQTQEIAILHVHNRRSRAVNVYQRTSEGAEELYTKLEAGEEWGVRTVLSMQWVVRDADSGKSLSSVTIDEAEASITLRNDRPTKPEPNKPNKPHDPEKLPPDPGIPPVLSQKLAKRVEKKAIARAKYCGEKEGAMDPKVSVSFTVSPAGKVKKSAVKTSQDNTMIGPCIASAIAKIQFPPTKEGGSISWTLPLY